MLRPTLVLSLLFTSALCAPVFLLDRPAIAQDAAYIPYAPADLQQMVAPVALYPDALLAQILVGCTYPGDIAAAVQYLDGGGDPNGVDDQGWDLSVAGIARYPDLLHYMNSNGDWMNSLGSAFLNQQADVMNAVQALRGEALAAGNLVSNDQQTVVTDDDGTIEIIPTNPQEIYPPIYDPTLVYQPEVVVVGQPWVPLISFWHAIPCGVWLHHDLDWHDHTIYVGAWGADRPWWHHTVGVGGRFDYTHDRPGLYINRNITVNIHNHITNVVGGAWNRQMHDPKKAMPRFIGRPDNHVPVARPGNGFPDRHVEPVRGGVIDNYNHAAVVNQERDRGRDSVQATHKEPVRAEPVRPAEPARAPAEVERHALPPARETPRAAAAPHAEARPEPEHREAPEIRGGAVNNYNNGAAASRAGDRGAASRGHR